AVIRPYELWKHPQGLAEALHALLAAFPPYDRVAVTMTGELCDCFATKRQGVSCLLDAVAEVAAGTPVWVWRNDGGLVSLAAARRPSTRAAAHARLARMLCADTETCSHEATLPLAERVLLRLNHRLQNAAANVLKALPGPPQTIILSGSGEFLARIVVEPHLQ